MGRLIKTIIWLLSLLSIYSILYIGLGILWSVGYSSNYERINTVIINLSYSYFAGLIFYIFVSYLPYLSRKIKFKPIIQDKVNSLYNQINACVVSFQSDTDGDLIKDINYDKLENIIVSNSMYSKSFYGKQTGIAMDNFLFLNQTRGRIFSLIESILQYKEYLPNETIVKIEKIKDSTYLHLIKNYQTTSLMKAIYDSGKYKKEIAIELFKIIELIKKLKNK